MFILFHLLWGASFYTFISMLGELSQIDILAWVSLALLALAGILFSKGKWYGIFSCFVVGFLLIYSSMFDKVQILNEFWIGVILFVYYVVCMILQKTI